MKTTKHIPLKHYKVLLLQMARELIEKVADTGLKPSSKRNKLVTEIGGLLSQLERELKRDVTIKASAEEKRALYMDMYDGKFPSWALEMLFHTLTEESQKVNHKKAS
jgi:hypothetical protein